MESNFQLVQNGQAPQRTDINLISTDAALADDRVLWELLRMLPYSATPQKGILTYAKTDYKPESGVGSTALVNGSEANGSVKVMPFRALVASQDNSNQTETLRGIRSGYLVGSSSSYVTQALAANASGNPRWDLVYVGVTPASTTSATRYIKDPTTKVVSATTVSVRTSVTCTVNVVTGIPNASPTRPSLPSDAAGTFYIPLAYVLVPTGFGASSIVFNNTIHEAAPVLSACPAASGASRIQPANQSFIIGGVADTNQNGSTSTQRPGTYLPPTMVGGESRIILLQRGLSPVSPVDGDIIDSSVDWRFRYFRWQIQVQSGTTTGTGLASDRHATGQVPTGQATLNVPGTNTYWGFGQSYRNDGGVITPAYGNSNGAAVAVNNTLVSQMGSSTAFAIYVDNASGNLIFKTSGTGTYQAIVWLDATAPYSNYGTV